MVGVIYLLLFSPLDQQIRLTNDKSTLSDKSWNNSIQRYFNNTGKVMQQIKKLKDVVDYNRINLPMFREIGLLFDREILHSELKSDASRELYEFLRVILERMALNRQVRE